MVIQLPLMYSSKLVLFRLFAELGKRLTEEIVFSIVLNAKKAGHL